MIEVFAEKGYVAGMTDSLFAPNETLTRTQFVQVIYNIFGEGQIAEEYSPFIDVDSEAWHADVIAWAYEKGIVAGMSSTEFAPMQR